MSDCADLRDALKHGQPLTDELGEHAEKCEVCAELIGGEAELGRALASLEGAPQPELSKVMARVEESVARDTGAGAWLSSRATPTRLMIGVGLPIGIAIWILVAKARPDLALYPIGRLAAIVVAYSLLVGAALRHALSPLQRTAPAPWVRPALTFAVIALPFVVAILPAAHTGHPASLEGGGDDFVRRALACFGFGTALSLPVLVLWALLDRQKQGSAPLAALVAAGAGLVGVLSLELHCPITRPPHLLLGHASVAIALTLIYTGVRRAIPNRDR